MRKFLALILCLCGLSQAGDVDPDRTLRVIDFEERRLGNAEELPMHWSKLEGTGYPHYVNGALSTERARSGKYAFRLDLNGGSLAYRYDAGRIRVRPGSHYRVDVFAHTTPLTHARARLSAWFVDHVGQPIPKSIRHSILLASRDDQWRPLSVELTARDGAESLVVELALLQPAQYLTETLGDRSLFPQDIRGTAYFDDLSISQVPRVTISTDHPGNIFRRGEKPVLRISVNDRSTEDLAGQLIVRDALGQSVHQRSGALELGAAASPSAGQKIVHLPLPEVPPGWYEISLVMTSRGKYVGQHALELIMLADSTSTLPDSRFGLVATQLPFETWSELPRILPFLGAGRVKLAVWNSRGDIQQADSAGFDRLLVRLNEIGVTPTGCLVDLPPAIASKMPTPGWPQLLKLDPEQWRPNLAILVSRHANHLDRWQLGADSMEQFASDPQMRQVYARIYTEFAALMQKPDLAMPWPAWHELPQELPATVALSIPTSVLPHQIPLYLQDIKTREGHHLSLTLQPLDRQQYGRELQIRDLAQRFIYALSAETRRIDLPLPFEAEMRDDTMVQRPQELLMVARTLMTTLSGANFQGKVPMAEGVEAFLFDRNGQGILALWDRTGQGGTRQLALNLGERPRSVDLWGNVTPLLRTAADRASQNVTLSIGPTPIFLVDIDGPMAQLRASVAFDQPLIESSFVAHARTIRFKNPYRQAIAGTLKLKAPQGWTLNPPAMNFSLNPGETFSRSISIEFPYNSFAGPRTISAEFAFQADKPVMVTVPLILTLGLSDVGIQSMALRDGQDLVVQQVITNYGSKRINYTSFVIVPGQARQERLVTDLAPGRSIIKLYRFPNVKPEEAPRLRSGLREISGTRILNEEIEVR